MASDDDKVFIEIILDDGSVQKGFAKIAKEGAKSGEETGKNFSAGFGKALGAAVAIGSAVFGAIFSKKSIDLAIRQEDAINKLNTSLKLSGQFSMAASRGFQEFASSLQQQTRFGDEAILETGALIQALGKLDNEGLKQATSAAADLSAALGIDLRSAATLVGKAAVGEVGSFSRYGVVIKKGADNAETFARVLDVLNQKFGGAAAAQVNTFSGAWEQLGNSFGDLLETVGNFVVKSPGVINLFKLITEQFSRLGSSIEAFRGNQDFFGPLISEMLNFAIWVNRLVIVPFELVITGARLLVEGIATAFIGLSALVVGGVNSLVQGVVSGISAAANKIADFIESFSPSKAKALRDGIARLTGEISATAQAAADGMVGAFEGAREKMGETTLSAFSISGTIDDQLEAAKSAVDNAPPIFDTLNQQIDEVKFRVVSVSEAFGLAFSSMGTAAKEFAEKGEENFKAIGKAMFTGVGNAAGQAFASFGKAIKNGENGIQAFLDSFLASMGQMAIQLGTMFILQGLAYLWANLPNGAALIGAGAALAAFGGILAASGQQPAAPGGGGVNASGGVADTTSDIQLSPPDAEDLQNQVGVSVNIQGNVFDRQETGLEIVRILQDAFDTQGAQVVVT